MCKKAIDLLYSFPLAPDYQKTNTFESYDIWEMHEGEHLYSLSAMYAAFHAMCQIEKILDTNAKVDKLVKKQEDIKEYCMKYYTDESTRTLIRSNKDNICDISVLGTIIPFELFSTDTQEIKNTIERINMTLRTYTGGYIRFEKDNYLEGNNPWPIATLWMAMYNLKIQNKEEALKQIDFVTKTATEHGFLAEQVDNQTMQAKWAIGLGWAHAMYISALAQL